MPKGKPIDLQRVLAPLKDFQRRSVDYVFDRLYGPNPTRRFLLADEVGLGKTLVARGVIGRAIEHLRGEGVERIDIIYICSNTDIARQNISRLNVTGQADFQLASRITLLPTKIQDLEANELNFISFTPGTSFSLRSSTGTGWERWVLYWLLRWTWPKIDHGTGAMNLLQVGMSRSLFRSWINDYDPHETIAKELAEKFTEAVNVEDGLASGEGQSTYKTRFRELCQRFRYGRKHIPPEDRQDRNLFIGDMRELLAATCIQALEPDLIILDEFQRFKHLLRPDDPAGQLARHLFNWGDTRVLLLSATPYKMYTLSHEAVEEDHYADFLDTLKFLLNDPSESERVKSLLAEYRRAAYRLGQDVSGSLLKVKEKLQDRLCRVIARTERLAVTIDRSGMLKEITDHPPRLEASDVKSYLGLQQVADLLEERNVIEYWKSAPYLLNFMEGYQLKRALEEHADRDSVDLVSTLARWKDILLPWDAWRAYERIDPGNARLRGLMAETIEQGLWRFLWIPPALPYYQLNPPFSGQGADKLTKRLVFSSWHVVPRAVSVMMSYEADRRVMRGLEQSPVNTPEARERHRPLLMFSRSQGRLTGLPVMAMLYPSLALAELGDPLAIHMDESGGELPTCAEALACAANRISRRLRPLIANATSTGPEDESWYWAAPIMLDVCSRRKTAAAWFEDIDELTMAWTGSEDDGAGAGWRAHLREARRVAMGQLVPGGRPPSDLVEVLALMALAGPGICALRALGRVSGGKRLYSHKRIRHAAGQIAWGLRTLFNLPEAMALIRGMNSEEPYWRRVLEYCVAGGLQSVLDEYLHVLRESMGLIDASPDVVAETLAEVAAAAAGMRVSTPGVDRVEILGDRVRISNQRVRARFAMRFGQQRSEEGESSLRGDQVRQAFNSPFWPFVLVTTSIGQEGLDFHPYCHAVVHWNLPSNPVDLEQREGRIHRYKGHAVRKNLAQRYGRALGGGTDWSDPWQRLFDLACREPGRESDLSPFWVYPIPNGAAIERHVPALPMSRESARLPALRSSLAVYRMVFGQPRQDDLVDYLLQEVRPAELERLSDELRLDLSP